MKERRETQIERKAVDKKRTKERKQQRTGKNVIAVFSTRIVESEVFV